MKKYKLSNGATVLLEKNNSKSVAVQIMFKVGSNFETAKIAGISHYLEHMLFEGTTNRSSGREIANEIEQYGAEFNAYTTGDRTAYFIKIINKRFEKALEILSDMVHNPLFDKKIMEKEKNVVLKEINMYHDDPRQHQWTLFQKNVFAKHPAKEPTLGTAKTVKAISQKTLFSYFKKHYSSSNMIISISGNIKNPQALIKKYFGKQRKTKVVRRKHVTESAPKKATTIKEKRNIKNSYIVLGYRTVPRLNKDSYVLDVISSVLGRGQSGWMFEEIRNKRGLAYQVGLHLEHEADYGYFSVYAGLDKSKIKRAKELIIEQFRKLDTLTKKELTEAKNYLEGNYTLSMEDNFHTADNHAYWETIKDAKLADSYLKNIKKATLSDVKRVAKKYLTNNYTFVAIEQK